MLYATISLAALLEMFTCVSGMTITLSTEGSIHPTPGLLGHHHPQIHATLLQLFSLKNELKLMCLGCMVMCIHCKHAMYHNNITNWNGMKLLMKRNGSNNTCSIKYTQGWIPLDDDDSSR